jgi:hypothetical protein
MDYKRSGLPIVGDSRLMRKSSMEISMIDVHVYEDGGMGRIVSLPMRSVWIKGLGVHLQHEELLHLGIVSYFLFGPKLSDATNM